MVRTCSTCCDAWACFVARSRLPDFAASRYLPVVRAENGDRRHLPQPLFGAIGGPRVVLHQREEPRVAEVEPQHVVCVVDAQTGLQRSQVGEPTQPPAACPPDTDRSRSAGLPRPSRRTARWRARSSSRHPSRTASAGTWRRRCPARRRQCPTPRWRGKPRRLPAPASSRRPACAVSPACRLPPHIPSPATPAPAPRPRRPWSPCSRARQKVREPPQ